MIEKRRTTAHLRAAIRARAAQIERFKRKRKKAIECRNIDSESRCTMMIDLLSEYNQVDEVELLVRESEAARHEPAVVSFHDQVAAFAAQQAAGGR